jgi:transposase
MDTRKPYPSDVYDGEWAFVAPYLALVREDAPSASTTCARSSTDCEVDRTHRLCVEIHAPRPASVGDALPTDAAVAREAGVLEEMIHDLLRLLLRLSKDRPSEPTATIVDSRTLRSTPESGHHGGYDGHKKGKKGSKVHAAVDTFGYLLALRVSPANEDDRKEVEKLSEEIQRATGENVELAYVDQGYTGERTSGAAAEHGIRLEVVKHEEAKRGFVLLPRRWVVEIV